MQLQVSKVHIQLDVMMQFKLLFVHPSVESFGHMNQWQSHGDSTCQSTFLVYCNWEFVNASMQNHVSEGIKQGIKECEKFKNRNLSNNKYH